MAERRMFNKSIVTSDAFLEMPASAKCLYFTLNMYADDDGFVNSPRMVMRMISSTDDDMKILIAKKFVLIFEDGILVIKHWRIHNYIQKDRYVPTKYQEHMKALKYDENKAYTTNEKNTYEVCIQDVSKMDTQDRLGKDRLGKDRLELNNTHTHVDTREDVENVDFLNSIPTLEEIQEFITLKNFVNVDAQRFKDYYDSVGWKKGNTPITNWQALVGMWEREEFKQNGLVKPATASKRDYEERPKSEQHNESVEVDLSLSLEELEDLL